MQHFLFSECIKCVILICNHALSGYSRPRFSIVLILNRHQSYEQKKQVNRELCKMFPFVGFLYLKSHGIETDSFWRENTIKLKNIKAVCSKYDQKLFQSQSNGKKLDSPVTSPDEDFVMP